MTATTAAAVSPLTWVKVSGDGVMGYCLLVMVTSWPFLRTRVDAMNAYENRQIGLHCLIANYSLFH